MKPICRDQILIVLALEIEAAGCFDHCKLLYTGVGKVNAAIRLTKYLLEWKAQQGMFPRLVLNIGSAGSAQFATGTVVNCTKFVQRDLDATALGFGPYATPYDPTPNVLSGIRFSRFAEGTCGTGDHFATDGKMTAWDVVDMEAYAMAKACAFESVPFGCLKYITDGANGAAGTTWEGALLVGAKALREAVDQVMLDIERTNV